MRLVRCVYDVVRRLLAKGKSVFIGPLRRAFVSISSNIAEGVGRLTTTNYTHFLAMVRRFWFQGNASEEFMTEEISYGT